MIFKEEISSALAPYHPYYERILKTGSRVICSPPPENTDEDYILLCTQEGRHELETRLLLDGWMLGGSLPNGVQTSQNPLNDPSPDFQPDYTLNTVHDYKNGVIDQTRLFHSWKRFETPAVYAPPTDGGWLNQVISPSSGPEINLLVTCNEQYFDDFTRATFLCRGLNLLDKADRVIVFEALTRDVWPTERKKESKKASAWRLFEEKMSDQAYQNLVNPVVVTSTTTVGGPITWNFSDPE